MAATVLIVDDDPTLVEMLTFVLERAGFETRNAQDGARALAIANAEEIDLIVLDVMLPDMDGFEICQRIREMPRGAHVPILMLSARTQIGDRLSGFESGADDYVPKPADPKEIVARARTLVGRSKLTRGFEAPVITFVATKGGVGNTTTALNVALAQIAERKRVALIELGAATLSAPWLLGLTPEQTLLDQVPPKGMRLSQTALQACTLTHESGLHYLPGRGNDIAPTRLPLGLLGETIRLLQATHDLVLVDLAAGALPAANEALIHATAIVPVVAHDGMSAWHLPTLMRWIGGNKLTIKVPGFVLVDQSLGPAKESPLAVADAVGLGILQVIPEAATALYHANARQEPLYLADPECPASLAYAELGRCITSSPIQAPLAFRP